MTIHTSPSMKVVMRGGHGSREKRAYRRCTVCGRGVGSYALYNKPWYVLRSQPPPGEVFADGALLLISDTFVRLLDHDAFPDLKHRPVLVMDEPIEPVPELGDPEPTDRPPDVIAGS